MALHIHKKVDARGLLCPLPTVKVSLALEDMSPGQTLLLLADDPATQRDLPAWCREFGHRLLRQENQGGAFSLTIQKGQ